MGERSTFPILSGHGKQIDVGPVPWSFVEPHRAQAMRNHGQTLERLAERGGLSVGELLAVIEGRNWVTVGPDSEALPAIQKLLEEATRAQESK